MRMSKTVEEMRAVGFGKCSYGKNASVESNGMRTNTKNIKSHTIFYICAKNELSQQRVELITSTVMVDLPH